MTIYKFLLLAACSGLFLISPLPHAFADKEFENCHDKYFGYGKLECFTELASTGNADAEFSLGNFYYLGMGVKQDYSKARDYYQKAADQGYPKAQYVLGFLSYWGDGVKKDYAKAYEYYQKAAEQGYSLAQFQLGVLYELGQGVKQDEQQASFWLEKAAGKKIINNHKPSSSSPQEVENYVRTAYDFAHGTDGFRQDYKQAAHLYQEAADWYREAAHQADEQAAEQAGVTIKKDGFPFYRQKIEQIKNLIKKANMGDPKAQTELALFYKDADWYKKLDNSGNEWKIINDARKADWRQALKWLQKAASKNYTEAQYQLGLGYYDGSLNLEEASLIEKGDGRDVPTDVTDNRHAFKWWLKAAQHSHAEAQAMLASLYEEGDGVPRNIHKAVEWYKKSCANGDEEACGKTEIQDYMRH